MKNGDGLAVRSRLVHQRYMNGSAGAAVAQAVTRFAFAYPSSPGYGYGGAAYGDVEYGGSGAPLTPTTTVVVSPTWADGQGAAPTLAATAVFKAWADGQQRSGATGSLAVFSPFADGQSSGAPTMSSVVPRAWADGQSLPGTPAAVSSSVPLWADGQIGPGITAAEGIIVTVSPVWADGQTVSIAEAATVSSPAWASGQASLLAMQTVVPRAWADGQSQPPALSASLTTFSPWADVQVGPGIAPFSGIVVVISPVWADGQARQGSVVATMRVRAPWADGQVYGPSHGTPIASWTTNEEFAMAMKMGIEGVLQLSVPVVVP